MATSSNPVDLLNAAMNASVLALSGGDFSTALTQALIAQGLASVMPKGSRGQGSGGGSQSAEWNPEGIDNFIRRLRQQQGASLGVQTAPIVMSEPETYDDGSQFANSSGGFVQ